MSDYNLPVVKTNIASIDPPDFGIGIRVAIYQGARGYANDGRAVAKNLVNLRKWAKTAAQWKPHVLVLPELFLSGYNIWKSNVAQVCSTQAEVEALVGAIADANNLAIICPYAELVEANGARQYFDSIALIDATGKLKRNYRKTHLWGDDEKTDWWFPYVGDDGSEAYNVDVINGIKVGLLNCYEAEMPELLRIMALKGSQVTIIPTAADVATMEEDGKWSDWAYPDVSRTIIPTNAYQNKNFCIYVNRALCEFQSDDKTLIGVYLGNSTVADPNGDLLVHADNVETLLIADCVPGKYQWPTHPDGQSDYIKDRRPGLYSTLTSESITLPDGTHYDYPEDPNTGWHKTAVTRKR